MTDRAEIERLLNQTGRTLEGLQTEDQMFNDPKYHEKIDEYFKARHAVSYNWPHTFGLYQSQMIELLVGALRDALDKPMQKPLTLEEANRAPWVYFEERPNGSIEYDIYPCIVNYRIGYSFVDIEHMYRGNVDYKTNDYGVIWRCWASRPTDEEREAAAWET